MPIISVSLAVVACAPRERGLGRPEAAVQQTTGKGNERTLPNCPVMDQPIDFAISVRTADGPVYFCCKGCIAKYQANPAKYAEKVAAQRKALANRP